MKTNSKRFLKGALAMLLAVIMLFGSCISGFAAVVDNAQTKANSSGGHIYFIKPATWTGSKVQFCIGHGSYTSAYEMSKLSGNLYYLNLKNANGGNSWNGNTYHAVIANSSNWGSGNWGSSNLTNATNYTTANSEYGFNDNNTYLITCTNTAKGATITTSYKANNSTQYTTLNSTTQTVYSYSTTAGGSTYTADAAAASTLSVKTQQLNGNGSIGTATTTSKTASATSANRKAAQGSAVTVTAAAADGYTFKGWFSSATSTTALSTATSYTYNAGTGNTSVYAKFEKAPKYSVTYNANGGTGAPAASTNLAAGSSHTVSSTVPTYTGYNFKGWNTVANGSGATYTAGQTITVNSDIFLYAQWAKVHTITYNANGGTGAPANGSVEDGSNYTISSTVPTKANYNFTGWKDQNGATYAAGATISAVSSDMTLTAQWELAGVCSPAMAGLELEIDETGTVNATTNQFCEYAPNSTFTYSIVDGGEYITLNGNVVTPKKPGTAHVKATCSCGETVTCAVTVKEPVLDINPEEVALLIGQSMTEAFVASANVGNPTVTFTSKNNGVATVTNGKATAVAEGNVDIEASLKFNNYYTATICAKVSVSTPTITADPTSVALEFGEGSTATSKTVTLDPNTEDGNGTGDNITVTTDNASVATATVSGTTLTINATGLGSTTVTAHFHDAEVEIPVTVTKYDPYVYLYVTDSQDWGNMFLHSWKGSNSNVTTLGQSNAQMIYIGRNGDDDKIFAYRFLKGSEPEKVIMVKQNSWPSDNLIRTDDYAVDFSKGYAALYIDSSTNNSGRRNTGDWTDDCMIVRPTVSVADVVVPVGGTETATATVENGGVVYWTTTDTTKATVADVTTATATVTGVTPGETTITARAFIDTANSSIKTLPTNYKTDTACWDFISTEATASVTVGSVDYDITATAKFSNNGTDYTSGTTGGTVKINSGTAGATATASIAHGTGYTLTAAAKTGYSFVGWYNGDTEVSTDANYTVASATAAVSYTAKFIKYSTVTFNGSTTEHAVGSTVTLTATPQDGYYLSGVSSAPTISGIIADSDTGNITFTMPANDVTITASYTQYAYVEFADTTGLTITGLKTGYKAGENITITVTPTSEQVTISAIVADNAAAVITQNGDNWTVTIASMPADTTITLTTTVDAKFKMDYGMVAIGNYGSGYTTYGTVAMTIDGTALTKGGYVDKTDTVTYTATANTNFIFDGWYSDESCSQGSLLTRNTSYDVTPTKDTTLYALFVPKHYIAENQANVSSHKEMTYDPATRSFKYSSDTINASAWFRVSNNPTTSAWTDSDSYSIFDSSFSVTFNANSYLVTVGWGSQCYALTSDSSAEHPYEIIVTLNGNSSIDVSCKAAVDGIGSVFLSSGRLDLPGSYNVADFEANIKYTHIEESANPTDTYVANEGENREKYKRLNLAEAQTVSFEVEITGNRAADYEVDSFVVYHIDTETYTIVAPNTLGNNKYNGSVYVDGPCYIVPIYFLTEEYANTNGLVQIDIYFDATAILDKNWGPFVACYTWGSNSAEYSGGWSGQMMIPSEDGSSFYTMITVPSADAENPPSVPNGVTFNNYMQSTVPGSNAGAFGVSSTQYQCYDYREPITLYEEGYDVITFVAKESTDGYHGDRANGVTVNTVTTGTTDIFNKYDFDYLYNRNGNVPMDLNGDDIENPVDITTARADYYIIAKGDITYDPNGTKYDADNQFDADWAVDWYVFDSDGTYITHILSDAMYNEYEYADDGTTYLENALGLTAAQAAGKTIAISYDHENNAGHQISYDGQWYGNYLTDYIHGNVIVGLVDDAGNFNIDAEDPTNVADYGEGYLIDAESGEKFAELDILMDLGEADLTATAEDGYRFVGWYTYSNGKYTKISSVTEYNTYINMDTTYYAMFKEIGSDEVVINHLVYNNPTDPHIPSHGGVSQMLVEVYDSLGNLVDTGSTPSTSISTAAFVPEENEIYTIKIKTTPLMNGKFFAWYTDSENADGSATYEEILVDDTMIGSETIVQSEFEYEYDVLDPVKVINIYSDVTRVSNKANLYYKYLNRFGEWRTYTALDVPLTDDECLGFEGNEVTPYCPAYLTLYTFGYENGNEVETVYCTEEELQDKLAQGLQVLGSYNKIQDYAPSAEVTEVYNGTVDWVVNSTTLSTTNSIIVLYADQGVPKYTVNYTILDETYEAEGYYNELLDIIAPATDEDGKAFSYWYDSDNDEILTYTRTYNYRIIEDKNIVAVYGESNLADWTPTIETVTYTREFGDGGDYIYTDYHLAYTSREGLELNKVKAEKGIEYGFLVFRDSAYYINDANNVTYPDASNATIKSYLESVASDKKKNMAFTVNGTKYNCYYYNLSDKELTNFNRCDYYLKYDNNKFVSTDHYYRECAFTAVAYIIVDGTVYLSNPEYINFYDLGLEEVSENN